MRVFILFVAMLASFTSCSSRKGTVLSKSSGSYVKKGEASSKPTSTSGLAYIEQYKDIAIQEMNQYGIPASIKLAQALLESGNGNSYLAREANNHFGIKCGGVWNGKSVRRADDNPNDCFRVYDSPEQSYKDHSQFLLRKRYEKLFSYSNKDYKAWAKGLREAGYATNPRYPDLLIDLIERYSLYKYDGGERTGKSIKPEKVTQPEPIYTAPIPKPAPNQVDLEGTSGAMIIHEVKQGQTLYSISRQYNLTVEQLKQLNNLVDDSIAIGQLLVISK